MARRSGVLAAGSEYRMLRPAKGLHRKLLAWYDTAKRDMPWRRTTDPYALWLSETMLQQTQVETVKPYWHRFLERFPTVGDLAAAELQEVLGMWAGLGYYRRAKNLHLAAQQMVRDHRGQMPRTMAGLLALPGVGRYTAGAVGSIAFGLAEPVVDGNVVRVISRLTGFDGEVSAKTSVAFFWRIAEEILAGAQTAAPSDNENKYGDINQSMMELGAMVCTVAAPKCGECPVREFCRGFKEARVGELPVKTKRAAVPTVRGVAAVILRKAAMDDAQEVLLMRRPVGGGWEGMWEFPVLANSSGLRTELGLRVKGTKNCGEVRHQLTHRLYVYEVLRCELVGSGAEVLLPEVVGLAGGVRYAEFRWVAWPLAGKVEVPVGRAVGKIAAQASDVLR